MRKHIQTFAIFFAYFMAFVAVIAGVHYGLKTLLIVIGADFAFVVIAVTVGYFVWKKWFDHEDQ